MKLAQSLVSSFHGAVLEYEILSRSSPKAGKNLMQFPTHDLWRLVSKPKNVINKVYTKYTSIQKHTPPFLLDEPYKKCI